MTSAPLASLLTLWERDAAALDRRGDGRGAALLRQCVAETRAAIETAADEVLTLSEAALVSGYSADHLRHLVADGTIANQGRKGAPRVRRGDLPARPAAGKGSAATSSGSYDLDADVARLAGKIANGRRAS